MGNDPTPQITGDTLAGRPIAIYDAGTKLVEDTSNAAGKFYTDLTAALSRWHAHASPPRSRTRMALCRRLRAGHLRARHGGAERHRHQAARRGPSALKPDFTATATDERTGVKQVEFQVALKQATPTWQTVSIDTAPDTGTNNYAAVWPSSGTLSSGLTDGQYQFRVIVTDNAGNQRTSTVVEATVDSQRSPPLPVTAPVASGIFYTEDPTPDFTATAADSSSSGEASGVASVQFYYVAWSQNKPTTWAGFTEISKDTTADYAATWGSLVLAEGHYILAAKATDVMGNETALMNGASYAAGVTQEIIVDSSPPAVTITSPTAGQLVQEKQVVIINWTLTDMTPPATVKIEYTLDGSVVSPEWVLVPLADGTPNDGRFDWTTPEVADDMTHARIRITARDQAGPLVGDELGHTTSALSAYFTIDDSVWELPPAVTSLVASDSDELHAGVDGWDFSASWVLSTSPDIVKQDVYILPYDVSFLEFALHQPVAAPLSNAATSWTGSASLTKDSAGGTLTWGAYRIWIVVTDTNARYNVTKSATFNVVAD